MSAAPTGLYVVLTMRGVRLSKRRLENAVSAAERERLNRWLLARTLETVERWLDGLARCVFVSVCDEALACARRAGALTLNEPGGALGHNHAARVGVTRAAALGAENAMLLPCDLPYLNADALDDFAARAVTHGLVLAPDRHGTGTNAVIVDARSDIEFKFGEDSLARYRDWAQASGLSVSVCARRELGFDLDTPEDLAAWRVSEGTDNKYSKETAA